jgi:hypothetical protein
MATSQADAVIDQLEEELKSHYLTALAGLPGCPNSGSELRAILTDYFNWQGRRISAEPHAVHRSAELLSSAKAVEHRDLLESLTKKIVSGDNLNPHRSRGAEKISKRDRMLADWGVQHLHFEPEGGEDCCSRYSTPGTRTSSGSIHMRLGPSKKSARSLCATGLTRGSSSSRTT